MVSAITHPTVLDRMLQDVPLPGDSNTGSSPTYYYPADPPHFSVDLPTFLSSHFNYTDSMRRTGITGRIIVQFLIKENGDIDSAKIIKGLHPLMDAEALKAVMIIPRCVPYKGRGKQLPTRFMVPITVLPN